MAWAGDQFCLGLTKIDPFMTKTCAENDFYIFVPSDLDLKFIFLVILVQRYVSTELEVFVTFLSYFEKIGGTRRMDRQTERQTDVRGATLMRSLLGRAE